MAKARMMRGFDRTEPPRASSFYNRQIETLEIEEGDAITDSAEAFYLMKQRGIENVILVGVHTNMCVLGRPFGSLYQNTPLKEGTSVLLTGRAAGIEPPEPVAWTRITSEGGRAFYTSLGHPRNFEIPAFRTLLRNGIFWAVGLEPGA